MLTDSIGYIKLNRFSRNSYTEFKSSLMSLLDEGMTKLVLDLRGNTGGFIDIANSIVDEFLEDDQLIVFTKNNKEQIENYYATSGGSFEKGALYVLIDENSASASEIVAGALQDNDKGTIIGRRSFGKGLVQVEMDLGDGSAVRLTTARYYTPTGRSIQKPYTRGNKKAYLDEALQRIASGEFVNKDSIPTIDSLKFTTPKGKIVYGGGGIIPDVFVPIDTTSYMNGFYYNSIYEYAFEYVDANRETLLNKWELTSFITNFDSDNKVFNSYLETLSEKQPSSAKEKKQIKEYLLSTLASNLFGDEGFYRSAHKNDRVLQKVIELESQAVKK